MTSRKIIARPIFLAMSVWVGFALAPVSGAEIPLANLIADDVGICIEARDLKARIDEALASEWFARVRQLALVKQWQQSREFAKWEAGRAALEAAIEQPLDRFAAELFGEQVLLALTPMPDGQVAGVLLSQASRDGAWERALKLWDQLEPHEIQTLTAFGRSFQRRRKLVNGRGSGQEIFTAFIGRTFAISQQESGVRQVLARAEASDSAQQRSSLSRLEQFRNANAAVPSTTVIRVFVNLRAWDRELRPKNPGDELLIAALRKLHWVSLGLELRDGLVVHAVANHSTDNLPEAWQTFVAGAQQKSELAARLPSSSLIAGELHLSATLLNALRRLDTSEKSERDWTALTRIARGVLNRDLSREILPRLGPSIVGAVVPGESVEESAAPVSALLAIKLKSSNEDALTNTPLFRQSLDEALLTLLNVASVSHNSRPDGTTAVAHAARIGDATLRWLDRIGPYRPAFGVMDDHVALASDPRPIREFWIAKPTSSLLSEALFSTLRERHFAEHQHWLLIHCRNARTFLASQREPLQRQMARWRNLDSSAAARQLNDLNELLAPFDAVFAAVRISEGEVRLTLGGVTP